MTLDGFKKYIRRLENICDIRRIEKRALAVLRMVFLVCVGTSVEDDGCEAGNGGCSGSWEAGIVFGDR